jgi:hypothetical protein
MASQGFDREVSEYPYAVQRGGPNAMHLFDALLDALLGDGWPGD